ncbi:MAG: ABC transporter ATP-binding protein [Rhodanobacteraceae bacterium]
MPDHAATPSPIITLRARNLCKSFGTGHSRATVLRDLSMDVCGGELTLISGPSGCGKSTLLSILSGLQSPDSGQVEALNEPLGRMDRRRLEHFRLQHTGFIFQGFNLFSALNAREQVELPLSYLGLSKQEVRQRATAALKEVGLEERMHLLPAELSGGEKQRAAIARAVAKRPTLLFADEPTSALDAVNGQTIIEMLRVIARTHSATVLCVSHDPRLVAHADRVLTMEDGQILTDRRALVTPFPGKENPP